MTCSSTTVPEPTRLEPTDSESSAFSSDSFYSDDGVEDEKDDKVACRICLSSRTCLLDPRQDSILRPHMIEDRCRKARRRRSAKISRWIVKSCKCSGSGKAIHYGCLRECIISSLIFSSKFFDRVLCCTVCAAPYQLEPITWLAIEEDIRLLLDKFPYPDDCDWDKKPYAFLKHLKENRHNRNENLPHAAKAPQLVEEMKEVDRRLSPTNATGTSKK